MYYPCSENKGVDQLHSVLIMFTGSVALQCPCLYDGLALKGNYFRLNAIICTFLENNNMSFIAMHRSMQYNDDTINQIRIETTLKLEIM